MLTLITVNYNNAKATIGLLRALEIQTDSDFDIIVVDNDSRVEDRSLLGEYSATSPLNLDLIYSETNLGFSGGNNLAIRKALAQNSEWLLLINNDTTVSEDFIAKLKSKLPAEPSMAGMPLREIYVHDTTRERTAYAGLVRWLRPTLPHVYDRSRLRTVKPRLLYVIGAGALVHRAVFDKIGLWDEKYFLYFEDADFSLRARKAGFAFHWLDEPMISHGVSLSTRELGEPLLLRYHFRNALRFNWLHAYWPIKCLLPFWSPWLIIKQLVKIVLYPSRRAASTAILAGILDFYAGRTGQIKEKDEHSH